MTRYADVIIDITAPTLDKSFQYRIPPELETEAVPGTPVKIPFGKGKTLRKGYIVDVGEIPKLDESKIKNIGEVCREELTIEDSLVRLAYWMKEQYGGSLYDALRTVIPTRQKVEKAPKRVVCRAKELPVLHAAWQQAYSKNYVAKARLLKALLEEESLPYELVKGQLRIGKSTLDSLGKDGLVELREATKETVLGNGLEVRLNIAQQAAADAVIQSLGKPETFLLHGITGSGKTEVYMKIISEVLARGQQAIVLIPEIALTYQTVLRFYRCFGDRVAFLHSKMAAGERYLQSQRAKAGEVSVMIGPRSALFTPFPNLGLIVVDEEHETSYKSEITPKYHGVEVAVARGKMVGATVLLGSATPSLQSYYLAEQGAYRLLTLSERAKQGAVLAKARIVDLREELREGNRSVFSRTLREKMQERLERGEQILLFLNRRGYSGIVSCRSCGTVLRCPHCDISLTLHRGGKLKCHYCGYEERESKLCPKCGSNYIGAFGTGTQKVEERVKKEFPNATVLRMDADTTKQKDGYEEILSAFSEGKADILIGTQMIVKGHDFPRVTLVGILAADLSLGMEDYRSAERTFDLLAQAAGRAGRDTRPGEVIIQTYQPEHYAIRTAAEQDYRAFYEQEMKYRQMLGYPPVKHMLMIQMGHASEQVLCEEAEQVRRLGEQVLKQYGEGRLLGPTDAPLRKANDVYRQIIYVKGANSATLRSVKNRVEQWLRNGNGNGMSVQFDFTP